MLSIKQLQTQKHALGADDNTIIAATLTPHKAAGSWLMKSENTSLSKGRIYSVC